MKQKKCKICKETFTPQRPLQMVCGYKCSHEYAKLQKQKAWAKEKKIRKEKLMTRSEHLNLLQKVFNAYIRKRDEVKPCISCGTTAKVQYDAGHYRSVGAHPELRFNEKNVHRQCRKCNSYWGGNLIEYRKNLIELIGEDEVKELERNDHPALKLTTDEIKENIKHYKKLIKKM